MNVKSARGSSTTISWRSPTFFFSSNAAVNPAKLDPMITTRLRSELDMSLSLPYPAMRSDRSGAVGGLPCEGVPIGHHLHNCTFVYCNIARSSTIVNSTPVQLCRHRSCSLAPGDTTQGVGGAGGGAGAGCLQLAGPPRGRPSVT